jgi:hypothetical protein
MQSFTAKFDHFVLAIEGESIDALLAATTTLPARHCRQAMPNNGNPVQNEKRNQPSAIQRND